MPYNGSATTDFTYKIIYSHADNVSPHLLAASDIAVCIDSGTSTYCPVANRYVMQKDMSASSVFNEGDYTNGEQYYTTINLAAGAHNLVHRAMCKVQRT